LIKLLTTHSMVSVAFASFIVMIIAGAYLKI
jgi:hypothetical protein